jgi:hypothetical protein
MRCYNAAMLKARIKLTGYTGDAERIRSLIDNGLIDLAWVEEVFPASILIVGDVGTDFTEGTTFGDIKSIIESILRTNGIEGVQIDLEPPLPSPESA